MSSEKWVSILSQELEEELKENKFISARSTAQHLLDLSQFVRIDQNTISFLKELMIGLDKKGYHPEHIKNLIFSQGHTMENYCPAGTRDQPSKDYTLETWGSKDKPCYASGHFASWTRYANSIVANIADAEEKKMISERLALEGDFHDILYRDWVPIVTEHDSQSYEKLQPFMVSIEDWKMSVPDSFREKLQSITGSDKPLEWIRADPNWWFAVICMHRILRLLMCKWLDSIQNLLLLQNELDKTRARYSKDRGANKLHPSFVQEASELIYHLYRRSWTEVLTNSNNKLFDDHFHIKYCFSRVVQLSGSAVVLKEQISFHLETIIAGDMTGFLTTCGMVENWKTHAQKDTKALVDYLQSNISKGFKSLAPFWPFETEKLNDVKPLVFRN